MNMTCGCQQHSPLNGELYMEGEMQGQEEGAQASAMVPSMPQHNEVVTVSMAEPPPPTHTPTPTQYHPPPLTVPYLAAPFGFTVQPLPAHFQVLLLNLLNILITIQVC